VRPGFFRARPRQQRRRHEAHSTGPRLPVRRDDHPGLTVGRGRLPRVGFDSVPTRARESGLFPRQATRLQFRPGVTDTRGPAPRIRKAVSIPHAGDGGRRAEMVHLRANTRPRFEDEKSARQAVLLAPRGNQSEPLEGRKRGFFAAGVFRRQRPDECGRKRYCSADFCLLSSEWCRAGNPGCRRFRRCPVVYWWQRCRAPRSVDLGSCRAAIAGLNTAKPITD